MDIISGDWFFSLADGIILDGKHQLQNTSLYHFTTPESLYFTELDWQNTRHPRILAIYGDIFEKVLDRITIFVDCEKILVHNSDTILNEKIIRDWLDKNPTITLYAQNLTFFHPRAFVLPSGIEDKTYKEDKKINFQKLFQNEKFADIFDDSIEYEDYTISLLYNSFCKFTVCSSELNLDTKRIWESLAIGSIPIVTETPFIKQLLRTCPDLPIQIVTSLTDTDVENFVYNFPKNFQYASQGYWESKILGPPIFLVHLGKDIPEFVYDNIQQIRLWNPLNTIYFIGSSDEFLSVETRVEYIHTRNLPIVKEHFYFLKNSKLDDIYKFGFWRFSTERVFLLLALMEYKNIYHFIHFENDVMSYCDIEKDLADYVGFQSKKKLVVSNMNSEGRNSLASFACNCRDSLKKFCIFLATKNYNNDMEAIWTFGKKNPDLVCLFPSKPEDDSFIVDSAFFGQFLGGPDPLNQENPRGIINPGYLNKSADINYKDYTYKWKREINGLWRLYINNKKVYTLHIHSKSLTFFRSDKSIMLPIPTLYETLHIGGIIDFVKENGFFIDVGSGNGVSENATFSLEKNLKWKGLLIEPNLEDIKKSITIRKNSKAIHCACVSSDYKENKILGDFMNNYIGSVEGQFSGSKDLIEVPARTLNSILEEYIEEFQKIDILYINANHYELNVLKGITLSKYRPNYIVVSIFKPFYESILQHLFENKYRLFGCLLRESIDRKWNPLYNICLFKDTT